MDKIKSHPIFILFKKSFHNTCQYGRKDYIILLTLFQTIKMVKQWLQFIAFPSFYCYSTKAIRIGNWLEFNSDRPDEHINMRADTDQQGAAATQTLSVLWLQILIEMNNQWSVPQSLSGSWGSMLPIISLCVKLNVKTHSTSMSHISRQHSQRYGWHPACLPQHTPNHTLFWAVIKPHTSISGEVWAMWDMIIQYQLCGSRHEKRKQQKQTERGGKSNLMTHTTLLNFVVMLVCRWSVMYYFLNGC